MSPKAQGIARCSMSEFTSRGRDVAEDDTGKEIIRRY